MIILDVEIKKAILGRGERPIQGIEYCKGWRDFEGMGIACVCTYDVVTHLSRVFLEENLKELAQYLHRNPTAGFNTKRFDIPLLREHGVDLTPKPSAADLGAHYDMLEEIWLALGLDPDQFNPRTHGGWGLDAVCQATLGIAKTGHGAAAPVWWQQGKRGKVIDYCLNDVWMEGSLLLHILRTGTITCPPDKVREYGETLQLRRPPYGPLPGGAPAWWEQEIIGRQYGAGQAKAFKGVNPSQFAGNPLPPGAVEETPAADSLGPGGLGIIR